jgi:hypothetical protein
MATTSVAVRPASRMRPKYALFTLVGLMIAYVLVHNESFLIHPNAPVCSTTIPSAGGFCPTDWRAPAPFCSAHSSFPIVYARSSPSCIASPAASTSSAPPSSPLWVRTSNISTNALENHAPSPLRRVSTPRC